MALSAAAGRLGISEVESGCSPKSLIEPSTAYTALVLQSLTGKGVVQISAGFFSADPLCTWSIQTSGWPPPRGVFQSPANPTPHVPGLLFFQSVVELRIIFVGKYVRTHCQPVAQGPPNTVL